MAQYPISSNPLNSTEFSSRDYYQDHNEDDSNYDNLVQNLTNPTAHQCLSPEFNHEKLMPNKQSTSVSYRTSRIAPPPSSRMSYNYDQSSYLDSGSNANYSEEQDKVISPSQNSFPYDSGKHGFNNQNIQQPSVRLVPQQANNNSYLSPNEATSFQSSQLLSPSSEKSFSGVSIRSRVEESSYDNYGSRTSTKIVTPVPSPNILPSIQMATSSKANSDVGCSGPESSRNQTPPLSQDSTNVNSINAPTTNGTKSGGRFSKLFKRKGSYQSETSNNNNLNISGLDNDINSLSIGGNNSFNGRSQSFRASSHKSSSREDSQDESSHNSTYDDNNNYNNTMSSSSSLFGKLHVMRHNFDKADDKDAKVLELNNFLSEKYYDSFNFNWNELAQIYLFGNTFNAIFGIADGSSRELKNKIFLWLLSGGDQAGLPQFEFDIAQVNIEFENTDEGILKMIIPLVVYLDPFKSAVSHLKQITEADAHSKPANSNNFSTQGLKSQNQDHSSLERVANRNSGIPIPLSQSLLANWMVEFDNDGGFSDSKSQSMFRRAARNSYVLAYLINEGFFEPALRLLEKLSKQVPSMLLAKRFENDSINCENLGDYNLQEAFFHLNAMFIKDNRTALGMSFFGIANVLHGEKAYNKAINLFEIGAHLSFDLDCCGMAVMGLNSGYGFGKKRGKEHKFQRKRRAAQIYRIIKNNGGELDVGTSWAFKDKYD